VRVNCVSGVAIVNVILLKVRRKCPCCASVHLPIGKNDKSTIISTVSALVGLCHHGIARPQFADRGMASDKEGSCE
jgi:hypothetical protein